MNNTYCKRSNYELTLRSLDHDVEASLCCKSEHPISLFETDKLAQVKKDLANGVRNHHCTVCWKAEDAGQVSWRQIGNDIGFHIKSVEIYFDNICDQACIYCNSKYSSKWAQEVKNSTDEDKILLKKLVNNVPLDRNSKINHKTEILNEIIRVAKESLPNDWINILLLGGEPLLSQPFKQTNILKEIAESFYSVADNNTTLILTVISNGNTPDEIINRMILDSKKLKQTYANLKIIVQISIESTDKNAEFVRYGLDYDQFLKNYIKYLSSDDIHVGFCMAVNTVSFNDTANFLQKMFDLAKEKNKKIFFNFNLVNYPEFLCIKILPNKYRTILDECEEIITKNRDMFVDEIFYSRVLAQLEHAKQTLGTDVNNKHNQRAQQYFSFLQKTRKVDLKDINFDLHNFLLDNTA
jgi:MoaA/NifB/PqqE/SkfB family radical SAM enzyme